ncbi:MAG: hypothetical protein NVSMB7_13570 [Chitinophagaceae bacterium]
MKYSKGIGLLSVIIVVVVCYTPWVYVPAVQLQIGGMFANGKQNFGKPGLMNLICSAGAAILFMLPQVWAMRANIFFCGFNIAWAIRNYILLSRCYGGDCPVKQTGLYVLVIAAALMLLMALMPGTAIKEVEHKKDARTNT